MIGAAMEAAVAVGRFGLGARPGELATASSDPRGWLKAQITPSGAEQPQGPLPTSADRFIAYRTLHADVRTLKSQRGIAQGPTAQGPTAQGPTAQGPTAQGPTAQGWDGAVPSTGAPPPAPTAASGAPDIGEQFKAERRTALKPLNEAVQAEILARARLGALTPAPFRERWALFWANHFTVSTAKAQAGALAGPFEREAIRPHVFGRFEDLLVASTTHPAMLIYLDQTLSAGPNSLAGQRRNAGLNENLGREILELHTVGPDAGYTQADVTEFARALTGYSVGLARDGAGVEGRAFWRPNLHEPGARQVMGRRYGQGSADQARAILAALAADPRTADHLARKIATHFLADTPPQTLVGQLKRAYLDSRGDLGVVAAALVSAPEAWTPAPQKFKRPYEFLISSYRAAGAAPAVAGPEVIQPLTQLGERPFAAPQPNGWSDQAGDWAAPDALVKRLVWSARFAAAYDPDGAPTDLADQALGARLSAPTRLAMARAETRPEALTLMLMSPEFQRR